MRIHQLHSSGKITHPGPGQEALILSKNAMDDLLRYLWDTRDQQPENIKVITQAAIISNREEWLHAPS